MRKVLSLLVLLAIGFAVSISYPLFTQSEDRPMHSFQVMCDNNGQLELIEYAATERKSLRYEIALCDVEFSK